MALAANAIPGKGLGSPSPIFDQESHPPSWLPGHKVGSAAGEFARFFGGQVVCLDLRLNDVVVGRGEVDFRANMTRMQIELLGKRCDAIFRIRTPVLR